MPAFRYQCIECGKQYDRDAVRYLCPDCGRHFTPGQPLRGVLQTVFDFAKIKPVFDKPCPDWSLICAVEPEYHPPFPVGNTPFVTSTRLGEELGFSRLYIKNDGLNPSGSLKDRASYLMAAEAIRLGEPTIVTASTGNAAAALAAVCAASGRQALIFVPAAAPKAKLVQMLVHGAEVVRVNGSYDDAFRLSIEYTSQRGGLNRNTAYHPLTIEGKKTVALEIYEQFGGAPDVVIVPVGDGVIIAGVHKGFCDLRDLGLIERVPRLIAVQADTSDAIHRYVVTGEYHNAPAPRTFADSISVSAPSNALMARRAIVDSGGCSVTVSDDEISEAQLLLARTSGIFTEPAAAATAAGLYKLDRAKFNRDDSIVLLVTGHGLKNVDAVIERMTLPEPIEPTWDALQKAIPQ
ncbi:MAG: threonine synthase [Calditrichota bacterium]